MSERIRTLTALAQGKKRVIYRSFKWFEKVVNSC